ncbi:hypothetical protein, partial [Salmonella sp. s54836]|uniref:hypothetical protein n=1 Tax=Salmonella sp. s54836 TaxID=3159673 RepID=UPI00397F2642
KKQVERGRTLWQADTPPKKYAYSDNFCQWISWYCCPCFVYRTMWRVTPQGIRHRRPKPFGEAEQGFIDFRFLKDLEIRTHKKCCFFCPFHELVIFADDASNEKKSGDNKADEEEEVVIRHPDAYQLEDIIRNAWSDVKLVAD